MPRKKAAEIRWITAKEATAILKKNSGRDDIPNSYIRSLARSGKVETKKFDDRTNLYNFRDVEGYIVERRDRGKGTGKSKEEAVA
ncbi:MAG: hypothetical protein NVSMB27_25550 [Ktedonobacteraceae bacterium]